MPNLMSELRESLYDLKAPKESGKTQYVLQWTIEGDNMPKAEAFTE